VKGSDPLPVGAIKAQVIFASSSLALVLTAYLFVLHTISADLRPWITVESSTFAIACAIPVWLAIESLRRAESPGPRALLLTTAGTLLVAIIVTSSQLALHPAVSSEGWPLVLITYQALVLGVTRQTRGVHGAITGVLALAWLATQIPTREMSTTALTACLVAVVPLAACAGRSFSRQCTLLAEASDRRSRTAAEDARNDEFQRHRLLLHDQISLLNLLSDETTSPELHDTARTQAKQASQRIRAFVDDPVNIAHAGPTTLASLSREVADEFPDLPIDLVTSLATSGHINTTHAAAIRQAMRTALHNVRNHAAAQHVVVHADHEHDGQRWELTIQDDGHGFDVLNTPFGFGLRDQVVGALAAVNIRAEISSVPGEGTRVNLSYPLAGPARGVTPEKPG